MPKTKRQYIEKWYPRYLGRAAKPEEIAQFEAAAIDPEARLAEILASPERQQYIAGRTQRLTAPSYKLGVERLRGAEERGLQRIGQEKTAIGDYYSDLLAGLQRESTRASGALTSKQSQLGLLRSGGTAAGLGEIQRRTAEQTGRSLRQKAEKLAELALQRTGLTEQTRLGKEQLGIAREEDIRNLREQMLTRGEAGLETVRTRQAQEEQARKQQEAEARKIEQIKFELSQQIPVGQSREFPGIGRVEGTLQPQPVERKTKITTANGRRLLIDTQTGETVADLGRAYKTTGGGGKKTTINPGYKLKINDIGGLSFYDRKGKPITAYQYLQGFTNGDVTLDDIANFLSRSKDPGDQQIIADIRNGVPLDELLKRYPHVLGG